MLLNYPCYTEDCVEYRSQLMLNPTNKRIDLASRDIIDKLRWQKRNPITDNATRLTCPYCDQVVKTKPQQKKFRVREIDRNDTDNLLAGYTRKGH